MDFVLGLQGCPDGACSQASVQKKERKAFEKAGCAKMWRFTRSFNNEVLRIHCLDSLLELLDASSVMVGSWSLASQSFQTDVSQRVITGPGPRAPKLPASPAAPLLTRCLRDQRGRRRQHEEEQPGTRSSGRCLHSLPFYVPLGHESS